MVQKGVDHAELRNENSENDTNEKGYFIMTPNEYQKLAIRTSPCSINDPGAMLAHSVYGLTSEAGEVSGILQKVYQGREIDEEHIKKELGDCIWMVAEACTALGFTLEDVMVTNIKKLEARFPDHKFDVYQDTHRAKGDI